MGVSSYPNGWKNGVVVKGVPIEIPNPGKVFWVNNSGVLPEGGIGGSDSNDGTYLRPFGTIDGAIGKCTANRGDVIYVMPGHVETLTAASDVDFDVAGVRCVGLGRGSKMARFDYTNAAGNVTVDADDVAIINMNFHANVTSITIGLSVLAGATDSLVQDCLFDVETTTTDEFTIGINYGVGCDGFKVIDTKMDMGLGGAATGIKLVGATAGGDIKGCTIVGDYSQANIAGITTASTEIYVDNCILLQGGPGGVGAVEVMEMLTGTTGVVRRCHSLANVATIAAHHVADTMAFFENYATEDVGQASGATLRTAASSVTASADD